MSPEHSDILTHLPHNCVSRQHKFFFFDQVGYLQLAQFRFFLKSFKIDVTGSILKSQRFKILNHKEAVVHIYDGILLGYKKE